jgi:CubicO group peptidase (beta-lactamase class C family)
MRRSLLALAAGLLLLGYAPLQADDFVYSKFGDYLEALRVQTGIPGLAAAVVGRTDVLWERGFGYQDLAKALPMRPDTPIHIDGLTQTFTATYILGCKEDNRFALDEAIGPYVPDAPEPAATFRQLLSYTTPTTGGLAFNYRPERLAPLATVVHRCEQMSYRATSAVLFGRLAMVNSVPGPDVLSVLEPPDPGQPDQEREHYTAVLERLATPYAIDSQRRANVTQYSATTITPSSGLISTAHDLAQFDLALRSGLLVRPETLAEAWRQPIDPTTGKPLPHGLGWFVQGYNGEPVIWQFGTGGEAGSSSMLISLPSRGTTLILLANSTGLTKAFALDKGDVTVSPFARVFLTLFAR